MLRKKNEFVVLIFILFCNLQFLSIAAIPFFFRKLAGMLGPIIALVFLIVKIIYKPEGSGNKYFATPIILLVITSIISFIPSNAFHGQSYFDSLLANQVILYYFVYFFLHEFKIEEKDLEKYIITIGLISIVFYYVQLILFPKLIFDIYYLKDRGTVRLFLPGLNCSLVTLFMFLNRFFNTRKPYYLVLCFAIFSVFVLQASRQLIFSIFFSAFIYLLLERKVRNKVLIVLLLSLVLFSFFKVFQGVIYEMLNVTTEQSKDFDSNVRVRAAEYFLTKGSPSFLNYLFGNGPPLAKSKYGIFMQTLVLKHGFFLADIGLIGDIYKYGIFFALSGLFLYFRVLRVKVYDKQKYWKYYVIAQMVTMFSSIGFFGQVDVQLLIGLYLLDINRIGVNRLEKTETKSFVNT